MNRTTYHRVDGIGKQLEPTIDAPLNPEVFEQAMHGMQRIVMGVGRLNHRIDPREDDQDEYSPDHEHVTEDGEKRIHVDEESMLYDVLRLIPYKWDVSILADAKFDNSYAVRTSVDCGGNVLVWATIMVKDGMFSKLHVGHTLIENRDDDVEIRHISSHESSRKLMYTNRYLEREVRKAYADTIESAATAFDYLATKRDIEAEGKRPDSHRDKHEHHSQKTWADIRGKTQQTVSDNVRDAKKQVFDLPDVPAFENRGHALEEVDPDSDEDGDIRLV